MFKHRMAAVAALMMILLCVVLPAPIALAEGETVRVAFLDDAIPYHFIDKDGVYRGMHIDMLNWIARNKNLRIEYFPYGTNSECLTALKAGSVDVILGYKTGDSAAMGFQYTDELSSSSLCLIAPNALASVLESETTYQSYRVVVEYGTANTYMAKMGIRAYLAQSSQVDVYQTLLDGQADMALCVRDVFLYLLDQAGRRADYTILRNYISPVNYAMLVRTNDKELFRSLDTGIAEMRANGSYEEIYKRWIVPDNQQTNQKIIRWISLGAGGLVSVALVIAVFNVSMNRILKRKVAAKTAELWEKNRELGMRMTQLQRESSLRYSMIEFASSGMVSFDQEYRILLMNHAALQLSGLKQERLGGDVRMLPIFGEILVQIRYDIFSEQIGNDKLSHPVTTELGDFTNRRCYRYNCYRSQNELKISSILLTVEDITSEERAKQELFEKEKRNSLNRLVAGIAHEIKNPLMAIRTAASLLKSQGDDREVQEAFARHVPNEVDRINQLVEGLINYAKPTKGVSETFCLAQVAEECLYLTKIGVAGKQFYFRAELDCDALIHANRDKIKQSIINIIINGIESMGKKHHSSPDETLAMRVAVYADQNFACVSVHDEGIGMSKQDIRLCTEPFYTTKTGGTGLGLALVQQFLEENGGVLEIRSEPGHGTTVILKFRRFWTDETQSSDH